MRPTLRGGILAAAFLAAVASPSAADITVLVPRVIYSHQVLGPVVVNHGSTSQEDKIPSDAYNKVYHAEAFFWTFDYDTQELVTVPYDPPLQQVIQATIPGGALVVPPDTLLGLGQGFTQGGQADGTLDVLQQKPGQIGTLLATSQQQTGLANGAAIVAQGPPQQSASLVIEDTYRATTPAAGDPVRLASGAFVSEETDFAIERLGVAVPQNRDYTSASEASGRLGPGWFYRYDTRIVMGTDSALEALAHQLQSYYLLADGNHQQSAGILAAIQQDVSDLEVQVSPIKAKYNATIAALTDYLDTPAILPEAVTTVQGYIAELQAELQNTIQPFEDRLASLRAQYDEMEGQVADQLDIANDLYAQWQDAERRLGMSKSQERSRNYGSPLLTNENSWATAGITTLVWVDEVGTPHLFTADAAPDMGSTAHYVNGEVNYYPQGTTYSSSVPGETTVQLNPDGSFTVMVKDGRELLYDFGGKLMEIRHRTGVRVTLAYDGDKPVSLSVNGAVLYTYRTDAQGRITRIQAPEGLAVSYAYDGEGRLAGVTDAAGATVGYSYSGSLLSRITKPDGSYREYTYDALGRAVKTTDEEGASEQFRYFTGYTEYQDPAGMVERHYFDSRSRETRVDRSEGSLVLSEYDDQDNMVRFTDELGRTWRYSYDARQNRTGVIDPEGNQETWSYTTLDKVSSYRDKSGNLTSFDYDGAGDLTGVHYPDGTGQRRILDSLGRVIEIVDARGGSTRISYDPLGYVSSVTDQAGATTSFSSDQVGNLVAATDPVGAVTRYEYNSDNKVVKATYADGSTEVFQYNNRKDLTSSADRNGKTAQFAYDKRHLLTTVTDPLGQVTRYVYRADGKVVEKDVGNANTSTFAYDARGNLVERRQVETGTSTRFEYDRANQVVASIDASGNRTEYSYTELAQVREVRNALNAVLAFQYSPTGRLERRTDEAGNTWTYSYDSMNRLVESLDPLGRSQIFHYDGAGNLITATDQAGNTVRYEYDAVGRRTAVMDPLGKTQAFSWDPRGLLSVVTDKAGNRTQYTYDPVGRLVAATDPLGGTTRYGYDADGNLIQSTDPHGNTSQYRFDPLSRLAQQIDPYGNATGYEYQILGKVSARRDALGNRWSYSYDELGRLKSSTDPLGDTRSYTYDGNGNVLSAADEMGRVTRYTFDALNRQISRTDPAGAVEIYTYDSRGNLTGDVNPTGVAYAYGYDELSRLTRETDRLGESQLYNYDAVGNLVTKTDFNGASTGYSYDALKRLVSAQLPDGSSKSYSYDANGNLTGVENPAGELSFVYDPLNRIVKSVDQTAGQAIQYGYDAAGNRTALLWGDAQRSSTYTYGKMNELLSVKDPEGGVTSYTYDPLLREVSRLLPNDLVTKRTYDPAGRLTVVKNETARGWGEQEKLSSQAYLYNAAGQRTYTVGSDGGVTAYSYDAAGRLSAVLSPLGDGGMQADFQERLSLGLYPEWVKADKAKGGGPDAVFQLPSVPGWNGKSLEKDLSDLLDKGAPKPAGAGQWSVKPGEGGTAFATRLTVDGQSTSALRDAYGQVAPRSLTLDTQQWMWTQDYGYDTQGNRVSKADGWGAIAYAYDAGDRMLSAGAKALSYDANGNLVLEKLSDRQAGYTYNSENRMVGVSTTLGELDFGQSARISYAYDALGRRVQRTQDASGRGAAAQERYLYDGMSLDVVAELTAGYGRRSGRGLSPKVEYTLAAGGVLSSLSFDDSGRKGETSYYHPDILGSTMMLTDEHGKVQESYTYDAFGVTWDGNLSSANQLGYTGQRVDPVTGLYDYGYRDYSPQAGRWTTLDPIKAGENWYAYVNDDPINQVDLWGLSPSDSGPQTNFVTTTGVNLFGASAGAYNFTSINNDSAYFQWGFYSSARLPSPTGSQGGLVQDRLYVDKAPPAIFGSSYSVKVEFTSVTDPKALVTQPNEAYFWTGQTNGVGGSENAQTIASLNGGKTLEMLMAEKGVVEPADPNDPAWDAYSENMAENASGVVHVVMGEKTRGKISTWERKEYPALIANERVRQIIAVDPATSDERVIFTR